MIETITDFGCTAIFYLMFYAPLIYVASCCLLATSDDG